MPSEERDHTIAPAILELAETRAIARSLPFAGHVVEYCSAEEISHLENGNGNIRQRGERSAQIPPVVFEELLVNALVHRDYLVSAPIRLFIFDNRIEIISPGHLPDNLTVAKIRTGNSNIRNPILVSYIAKGLLPYRGLGSGIKRALEDWPEIDFADDRDGCLFTATVHRKPGEGSLKSSLKSSGKSSGKGSGKTGSRILEMLQETHDMTIPDLAEALTISTRAVEKQIMRLRKEGRLRRIGPAKGGHWEVVK